jgi:hypothetical protein
MTGTTFHANRFLVLSALLLSTMGIQNVGILVFPTFPWAQAACVFVASFGSGINQTCMLAAARAQFIILRWHSV